MNIPTTKIPQKHLKITRKYFTDFPRPREFPWEKNFIRKKCGTFAAEENSEIYCNDLICNKFFRYKISESDEWKVRRRWQKL